jgi:hypothetical protein
MSDSKTIRYNLERIKVHLTIASEWQAMIVPNTTDPRKMELNEVACKNVTKSLKIATASINLVDEISETVWLRQWSEDDNKKLKE